MPATPVRVQKGLVDSPCQPGARRPVMFHTRRASAFPFTRTGGSAVADTTPPTLPKVASDTSTSPGLATLHRREAVFTASPMAVYWSARELPMAPVTTVPVLMPMPMRICS